MEGRIGVSLFMVKKKGGRGEYKGVVLGGWETTVARWSGQ